MNNLSRNDLIESLYKWKIGIYDEKQMLDWAEKVYTPGRVEIDDEYKDNSLILEIISVLESLNVNLIIRDDIDFFLTLLKQPINQTQESVKKLQKYFQSIDLKMRKQQLQDNDFYNLFI